MTKDYKAYDLTVGTIDVICSNLALAAKSFDVTGDADSPLVFAVTQLYQTGLELAPVLGLQKEQVQDVLVSTVENQLSPAMFDAFMQGVGLW